MSRLYFGATLRVDSLSLHLAESDGRPGKVIFKPVPIDPFGSVHQHQFPPYEGKRDDVVVMTWWRGEPVWSSDVKKIRRGDMVTIPVPPIAVE